MVSEICIGAENLKWYIGGQIGPLRFLIAGSHIELLSFYTKRRKSMFQPGLFHLVGSGQLRLKTSGRGTSNGKQVLRPTTTVDDADEGTNNAGSQTKEKTSA